MEIEFNFNKAASFIRSAAAQGAELVVLPEYQFVQARNQRLSSRS
jgi:predicted amidohydrolase